MKQSAVIFFLSFVQRLI